MNNDIKLDKEKKFKLYAKKYLDGDDSVSIKELLEEYLSSESDHIKFIAILEEEKKNG